MRLPRYVVVAGPTKKKGYHAAAAGSRMAVVVPHAAHALLPCARVVPSSRDSTRPRFLI